MNLNKQSDYPTFTIIICARNEEQFIERCIDSILKNDYPQECLQILVFDGESTDSTWKILQNISSKYPCVEIHRNPNKTAPYGFNRGIQIARGEYVTILGAHAEVAKDWIETILATYMRVRDADGIGGRMETIGNGYIGIAISIVLSSPFGVGNSSFRVSNKEGYVDTIVFGTYRRKTFDKYGLFDEEMVRNQDDELNYRIRSKCGKLFFNPKISTRYFSRSSILKMYRQYAQYGFWKPLVYRKCEGLFSFRQIVPPVFVVVMTLLALSSFLSTVSLIMFLTIIFLYLFAATIFTIRACKVCIKDIVKYLPFTPLLFLIIHFSYGINFIIGLIYFLVLKKKPKHRHQIITR